MQGQLDTRPDSTAQLAVAPKNSSDPRQAAFEEYLRLRHSDAQVSEQELVQDVVYTCQGIDGKHIKFDAKADGYVISDKVRLPRGARILILKLCELGWLYRKVRAHVSEWLSPASLELVGTTGQAFGSALQQELADYYRLMAVLEAQVQHKPPGPGEAGQSGAGGSYLSMRR